VIDGSLDQLIHDLRRRLDSGELAALGPLDLGDGTAELPGETVVRVLLADLNHLDRLTPRALGWEERHERRSELLHDFRRLRELLG
jgi:hypothetical protein